jgi:hypothetical protein
MSKTPHIPVPDYGTVETRDLLIEAIGHPGVALLVVVVMEHINDYLEGARVQMQRIWVNWEKAKARTAEDWRVAHSQTFRDIHYYFICWDTTLKMILFLKKWSGLSAPQRVYRQYKSELEKYKSGRDHLEHFEDRLLGKKKNREKLAQPGHLGDLDILGNYYFGGEHFDVSPKNVSLLEEIVSTLKIKLYEEAVQRIAIRKDPSSADAVV